MADDVVRRGRLPGERDKDIAHFLSSMETDRWIAEADLLVDLAHVLMLERQGLIEHGHASALLSALLALQERGIPGEAFDERFEDIHAGIEAILIGQLSEETGGRLHLGRSRNDEVATSIRIALRQDLLSLLDAVLALRESLLIVADAHRTSVMPGFTHTQPAQPTTLGHHLVAHADAFSRDFDRVWSAYGRVNLSPLGAAAFASTSHRIDRDYTAGLLGFDGLAENSMDAVASRDFALEVLSDLSILIVNESRLAEELVLWSSPAFGFLTLDDRYCSTSSIMPQKKNPDCAEIVRAKSGTVAGALQAATVIAKGLPMSYNRDLQELTPHLRRGTEAAIASTRILSGMVGSADWHTGAMRDQAGRGFSTATDLADYLTRRYGLPFRTAHSIVGRAVAKGSIDPATLDAAAVEIGEAPLSPRGLDAAAIDRCLDPESSVEARDRPGGPAPSAVAQSIADRKKRLSADKKRYADLLSRHRQAIETLLLEAKKRSA